jgi:hypothetical protein
VAAPRTGDTDQRRAFWLEVAVASVLGLTAIASAWAAYRATVVRDDASSASTQGVRTLKLGLGYLGHSDQLTAGDRAIFLTFTQARPARAAYIKNNLMRRELKPEADWWLKQKPGLYPSPFLPQDPYFQPRYRKAGREARAVSQRLFG